MTRRSPPVKNRFRTPSSMMRFGPSNTTRSISASVSNDAACPGVTGSRLNSSQVRPAKVS